MKRLLVILTILLSTTYADTRPLLVTGCARSGTGYISSIMQKSGYHFGHEQVKGFGLASWEMNFDTNWVPWFDARNGLQFNHVFHQVRHPLKTISSVFTTEPKISWDFIIALIPEIHHTDNHITKCAKYWYYWNKHAEAQAEWTYQLEQVEKVWPEFCARLDIKPDLSVFQKVSKKTNTRNSVSHYLTWQELRTQITPELFDKITKLADHYGYATE